MRCSKRRPARRPTRSRCWKTPSQPIISAALRPRVEVVGLGGAWQNLAMVRGWEATNGYNPLRIGLYDRLVSPGEENWSAFHRLFPPSFDNYDGPLARALGLTYLVMGQPMDKLPNLRTPPTAELLLAGPPDLDLSACRRDAASRHLPMV